jgi:hypothetical protein
MNVGFRLWNPWIPDDASRIVWARMSHGTAASGLPSQTHTDTQLRLTRTSRDTFSACLPTKGSMGSSSWRPSLQALIFVEFVQAVRRLPFPPYYLHGDNPYLWRKIIDYCRVLMLCKIKLNNFNKASCVRAWSYMTSQRLTEVLELYSGGVRYTDFPGWGLRSFLQDLKAHFLPHISQLITHFWQRR